MTLADEILALAGQELHSAEVQVELKRLADKVCEQVKAETPVFGEMGRDERRENPPDGQPGDARDAVHVEPNAEGFRVISRDRKAIWIEIGTKHMPEYAPFTKAAAVFGSETGPSFSASGRDSMADHGVKHAHEHLGAELEKLAKLTATGASAHQIAAARRGVNQARIARSAAFKAGRPRRGRRR